MRPIDETTVLLTGATDGLGRAVASRLAADGADLRIHGRDARRLAATAEELKSASGTRPTGCTC